MRIVVVGGGVVGLSCALALLRAGHRPLVLDPAAAADAPSWNNAGHIATEQVAPLASLASLRTARRRRFSAGGALHLPAGEWRTWVPFGLRLAAAAAPGRFRAGAAALSALLREAVPAWNRLEEALGTPDLVRIDGHLVAWERSGSAAAGRRAWEAADTGIATLAAARAEDHRLLAALLGGDVSVAGAARFAGTGQVRDLARLRDVLVEAVTAGGGAIEQTSARLTLRNGMADTGHGADAILVAAGVASGALLRPFGHHVPIVAERGYHIRAEAGDWPEDAPPIVFEDRAMIVTRYRDQVQASSFVEIAAPDAPPDPRKWERLEAHVRHLGLPLRAPFSRWMGARPTLPDYLPAIGRSRHARNLFYAFGHQHLGLTLAPVTAELMADVVARTTPAIDLAPFDLARFGDAHP